MNDAASSHAVVRVFDVFEHAEQARQALLDAGFDAGAVRVDIASDEAGAVNGNFSVGNGRQGGMRGAYRRNYEAHRLGQCVMLVAALDAAAAACAAAMMERFGARDIDALTRQTAAASGATAAAPRAARESAASAR